MNVKVVDMVKMHLKANGFDGLYSDECGCELSDLAPCGEIQGDCRAGYKRTLRTQEDIDAYSWSCADLSVGDWVIQPEEALKDGRSD